MVVKDKNILEIHPIIRTRAEQVVSSLSSQCFNVNQRQQLTLSIIVIKALHSPLSLAALLPLFRALLSVWQISASPATDPPAPAPAPAPAPTPQYRLKAIRWPRSAVPYTHLGVQAPGPSNCSKRSHLELKFSASVTTLVLRDQTLPAP